MPIAHVSRSDYFELFQPEDAQRIDANIFLNEHIEREINGSRPSHKMRLRVVT